MIAFCGSEGVPLTECIQSLAAERDQDPLAKLFKSHEVFLPSSKLYPVTWSGLNDS